MLNAACTRTLACHWMWIQFFSTTQHPTQHLPRSGHPVTHDTTDKTSRDTTHTDGSMFLRTYGHAPIRGSPTPDCHAASLSWHTRVPRVAPESRTVARM